MDIAGSRHRGRKSAAERRARARRSGAHVASRLLRGLLSLEHQRGSALTAAARTFVGVLRSSARS
eukprot:4267209-Alexandrium_andersonii.AAC.1